MKHIRYIILSCVALIALSATAANNTVKGVLDSYGTEWTTVGMDGKIKMSGLPMGIKPSIKLYMLRDSVIRASIRAPFVGEIGVLEIDSNHILLVNKRSNTYSEVPMQTVTQMTGMTLPNIQDLLLARIFSVGASRPTADMFSVEDVPNDNMLAILPVEQNSFYNYGFIVSDNLALVCTLFVMDRGMLTLNYDYSSPGKIETDINLDAGETKFNASLEVSNITFTPNELKPFDLTSKYREVSIKQLFK